jgi:hypothetical protein
MSGLDAATIFSCLEGLLPLLRLTLTYGCNTIGLFFWLSPAGLPGRGWDGSKAVGLMPEAGMGLKGRSFTPQGSYGQQFVHKGLWRREARNLAGAAPKRSALRFRKVERSSKP